ncbi:MAG: hypothetical protein R2764_10475 [Bacteroidales bacterium]
MVFDCIEEIARETRGQKKDSSVKNTEESDEVAPTGLSSNLFIEDLKTLSNYIVADRFS